MSERRRFRDRSQRASGGGQPSGIPPQHNRAGGPTVPIQRQGGGNVNGNSISGAPTHVGSGMSGGGGNGGGNGQRHQGRPNHHRNNGPTPRRRRWWWRWWCGTGGGRQQEPAGPPLAAGVAVEGLLQFTGENGDGHLRDPGYPLRPAAGNPVVPRSVIRELNLRPGLLLKGVPNGRMLTKIDTVEGGPPEAFRRHHSALRADGP